MRILQVSHDFVPGHRAGAEIYTHNLCHELAKRHKVHLFFTEHSPIRPQYGVRESVFKDFTYTEVINNHCQKRFEETYNNPRMDAIFRMVLDSFKPDVVHFEHLLFHSTNYPAIAAESRVPAVMTLHDFWPICEQEGKRFRAYFPDEKRDDSEWRGQPHGCVKLCDEIVPELCAKCWNRNPTLHSGGERAGYFALRLARRLLGVDLTEMARRRYDKRRAVQPREAPAPAGPLRPDHIIRRNDYMRQALSHLRRLICPSPFLAREMKRFGCPEDKLVVSDYGFKTDAFKDFKRTRDERLRIGFIGTVAELKGAHVLVSAFRKVASPRVTLEIFGDTAMHPHYTSWLKKLAGDAPVSFHGRFEPEVVTEVFSHIDALVVPSIWYENSPLVIHEAFMSRTPVIASDLGGMADLVQDGKTGFLFRPGDSADLAAKMQLLLDKPSLAREFGNAAPPVKTMSEDAAFLERLYDECLAATR
jgi:glycosyltransferase involved in cell wall biosynthesis